MWTVHTINHVYYFKNLLKKKIFLTQHNLLFSQPASNIPKKLNPAIIPPPINDEVHFAP